MTEQDIQDAISALYDSTTETPDVADDEYLTRRNLMNRALRRWQNDKGFMWDELWDYTTATVISGTSTYNAPATFVRSASTIDIKDSNGNIVKQFQVVKPNDGQHYYGQDYAYFTGSPSAGYVLHLSPTPDSNLNGLTIQYNYYKTATLYTAPTVISQIPDPEYIIHAVISELYKADGQLPTYQTSLEEAEERLKGMEVAQVANIDWNSNAMIDTTPGFGV